MDNIYLYIIEEISILMLKFHMRLQNTLENTPKKKKRNLSSFRMILKSLKMGSYGQAVAPQDILTVQFKSF